MLYSIANALHLAEKELPHVDNPSREAGIMLQYVLEVNRSYILSFSERKLSDIEATKFFDYVYKRSQGIPLAYILGEKEFYSLKFKVNENTLIPRPETELLVDLVLDHENILSNDFKIEVPKDAAVLDLGCGSGAIAISIAKHREAWKVYATDISNEALFIAKDNARLNKTDNVRFIQSNWYAHVPNIKFDLIVSNPPYIANNSEDIEKYVKMYEPSSALFSEEDGLADLKAIIFQSASHLKAGGLLLLEHGYNQELEVKALLLDAGFKTIKSFLDLSGLIRVCVGQLTE